MGQTLQAKVLALKDGRQLAGTVIVDSNFVIYVSPKTGKYEEILPWDAIRSILL